MIEEKAAAAAAAAVPAAPAVADAERMRAERIRSCAAEVNAVLEQHHCRLVSVVIIAGGQLQSRCEVESL